VRPKRNSAGSNCSAGVVRHSRDAAHVATTALPRRGRNHLFLLNHHTVTPVESNEIAIANL